MILARNHEKRNEYDEWHDFLNEYIFFFCRFLEKDFFEQGPDVYAASRTIEYNGRFRIYSRSKWVTKLEKPAGTLALNLNFQLEAVDLSQTTVNVDGLDHYGTYDL